MRETTVPEAAIHFGVTHHTVRDWVKKGVPHSRVPSLGGGERKILLDLEEMEKWLKKKHLGIKTQTEFVDVSEATDLLRKIRSLGYTKKQIAFSLEIPMSTLNTYLFPEMYGLRSVTLETYLKCLGLLKTSAPVHHPHQKYSKQAVIDALEQTSGKRDPAAKLLSIQYSTLIQLVADYGLESYISYYPSELLTPKMIHDALAEAGSIRAAAKLLQINEKTLGGYIRKLGL